VSKKPKYYVVWRGRRPGVYGTWAECFEQVNGYSGGLFKAFDSLELAQKAACSERTVFRAEHPELFQPHAGRRQPRLPIAGDFIRESYAVDAACSGVPGPVEYRCVRTDTGKELFRQGPFPNGTNNIGEFLAIVHALALFEKRGITWPIYSDSQIALGWVRRKECRTKHAQDATNARLFDMIARAEAWLRDHEYANQLLKWETDAWGEIPADYGRK
jgi:ribonuclease HI